MKELLIIATITKIITDLHKIFGKEKFLKKLLIIADSNEILYAHRTLIVLSIANSLILSFIIGLINILNGKIFTGFIAFSLISASGILLAFFNWKISNK